MEDVAELNAQMIDQLAKAGYVRSFAVEQAFRTVMRHLFVPRVSIDVAYSGEALVTRRGPHGLPTSSSSMPGIVAVMLEQLNVKPGHRVLEIGAGTGYNAALLATLAGKTGQTTTVDIDEDIVQEARENLDRAGFPLVRTLVRDGWVGVAEHAPYDRLEVTVGVWDLSPYWVDQLVNEGIMVVPLWLRAGAQASIAFQKHLDRLRSVSVEPCGIMRLRGPNAGPEAYVPIGDWNVSMDQVDTTRISILKELLQTKPREEPAPQIPARWFVLLALEEPRTVHLESKEDWNEPHSGSLTTNTGASHSFLGTSFELIEKTQPVPHSLSGSPEHDHLIGTG